MGHSWIMENKLSRPYVSSYQAVKTVKKLLCNFE
jgi:hypothetical protein